MKLIYLLAFSFIFSSAFILAQNKTEQDIDVAYQNAKKGIYWALSNIPGKKAKLDHDLIDLDNLYSNIKLSKEINGVKVVSTGFNNSNVVEITIYRSYESLKTEGYNVPSTTWEGD
ncbi:MAG TPA: hypothetical protein VI362_04915 [Ignavibacteriaceae bacterium]|nr:hypothetical protein [Ignavibacteriaceae bacterium]